MNHHMIKRDGQWVAVTLEEFKAHAAAQTPPPPPPENPRGLGDLVATLAEPIARFSDAHLGTHLVGCQSCAERRAALNKIVPKL